MKKVSKLLVLSLIGVFLIASMTVYAVEEDTVKATPEERYQQRVEKAESKHEERLENAQERYDESQLKASESQACKLEVVSKYAPDMVVDYETAFSDHNDVHEQLFETHKQLREQRFADVKDEMDILVEELFEKVENGEMTYKEVREELKAATESYREELEAFIEEIELALADAKAEEETNKEARLALKEELKAAIEAEDTEKAEEIIIELYDYLLNHIEFDQTKLEVLQGMLIL